MNHQNIIHISSLVLYSYINTHKIIRIDPLFSLFHSCVLHIQNTLHKPRVSPENAGGLQGRRRSTALERRVCGETEAAAVPAQRRRMKESLGLQPLPHDGV